MIKHREGRLCDTSFPRDCKRDQEAARRQELPLAALVLEVKVK